MGLQLPEHKDFSEFISRILFQGRPGKANPFEPMIPPPMPVPTYSKKLKNSLKQRILDNMHVTVSSTGVEETGKTTITFDFVQASYIVQRTY